jgi:hypothetical protein
MKLLQFHPAAESEMAEAALWYETQQTGLGKRFLASVQETLNRVEIDPQLYPFVDDDVRRCLIKTFPYGVLFRVHEDCVVIMAVMHLHRAPDYWKGRRLENADSGDSK